MSNTYPAIIDYHADCLACQIIAGEVSVPGGIIAENAWWVADHCLGKHGLGAVVVKTRAHRENCWDLTSNEAASLGPFLRQMTYAMQVALGAERIYINSWVDQPPYHMHFVLQPRYAGKAELGLQGLELQIYRALQEKPKEEDIVAIASRIREAYRHICFNRSLSSR
ncbi:MAG: diadenosine tetraphosphate hydrolase [Leptolyngbya sp. SIO1D8]|nr:diadenosine tetraphosphate hydrolase [Leptolyngbya sp. SIO1D8]